jgi:hypothetical protein
MGGGNVAEIGDLLHPGLRLLLALNSRGCNREQAQEHCKAQKHCSQLLKLSVHCVFSFVVFFGPGSHCPGFRMAELYHKTLTIPNIFLNFSYILLKFFQQVVLPAAAGDQQDHTRRGQGKEMNNEY